ncbi:MAG: serine/threonine-protein kinase [Myxococcota bacterium]
MRADPEPQSPDDSQVQPGAELLLGATLGEGAVATVVEVTDETGARFAVKILHASHAQDAAAQARFGQESALAQAVVHPNVVRVFGRRIVAGRDVLLMELVSGPDLASVIARNHAAALDEAAVLRIVHGIAAGLAAAHAAGVVHRDLKPANVLLADAANPSDRVPKIADFGMARASSLSGVDADAVTVLGTPDTMAPECLDPLAVDGRTDLYALGCIAFEMLTGAPPFRAATPFGVIQAHRTAPIPEIAASAPAGPGLRALVYALLAKSPADRPQAAAAVVERLQKIIDGETTALTLARPGSDAQCARCGGQLVPGLSVCLGCGMAVVILRAGAHAVVVTGPGEVSDKLDATLRTRLLSWLEDNPAMGLSAGAALKKRIPRLPFVLATGLSGETAATLVRSLETLGLTAESTKGRVSQLPALRAKTKTIVGRTLAIAGGSFASLLGTIAQHPSTIVIGVLVTAGIASWAAMRTLGTVTTRSGDRGPALPPPVRQALDRVQAAAPGIEHARHREALRAVVGRALALAPGETSAPDDPLAVELANAIDTATAATGRLDALDRSLASRSLAESSDETRGLLHDRDRWSARLLRLSATLESLAIRTASAKARAEATRGEETLEALRDRVDALEEVFGP